MKRGRDDDSEYDPDLSKKHKKLELDVGLISFGCYFIAGGDAGCGDEIAERKVYLNEAKAFFYSR